SSLTITITNIDDTGYEFLYIDSTACDLEDEHSETTTGGSSITCAVSMSGTTATVTLTPGTALTSAAIQTLINAMTYENTDEDPSTGNNRVHTITAIADNGGTSNGGVASASVSLAATISVVAADNDAPVNTVAGTTASEDVAKAITGTSVADVDDTSLTTVQLTTTLGTFTLATSSATYEVGTQGSAASTVTLSGTIANINVALATITWTSATNDNDNPTFTLVSTDGGTNADTDTFTVTVSAIND
ncbi:uncharacterized protein METZ01_LOCUS469838, partial [marine metagenome]